MTNDSLEQPKTACADGKYQNEANNDKACRGYDRGIADFVVELVEKII
jgi:hypothetical protein